MKKLRNQISEISKRKRVRATIIDVVGNRCAVRIGDRANGNVLRGIPFIGPAGEVGQTVYVDYSTGNPMVEIHGVQTEAVPERKKIQPKPAIMDLSPNQLGGSGGGYVGDHTHDAILLTGVSQDMWYDPTVTGFTSALAAAQSGDQIVLPAISFSMGDWGLPEGVHLKGVTNLTSITGKLTLGGGNRVEGVIFSNGLGAPALYIPTGILTTNYFRDCQFTTGNLGNAYAVELQHGGQCYAEFWNCKFSSAVIGAYTSYAFYSTVAHGSPASATIRIYYSYFDVYATGGTADLWNSNCYLGIYACGWLNGLDPDVGNTFFIDGDRTASLRVKEADGAPSVPQVNTISVTNGALTDSGSGVASLNIPQTFLQLSDTPNAYAGMGGYHATINAGETAIEFTNRNLVVREADGNPSVTPVTTIVFPNGSVADNGGGQVTISIASDHGALTGLADDDHAQYHNDSRADTWLASKEATYVPASLTVTYGTLDAGAYTDLAAVGGTDVAISEASGVNALQLTLGYTGVSLPPTQVLLYGNYNGGTAHQVVVELLNNGTGLYDIIGSIPHSTTKTWYNFPVYNGTSYNPAGAVTLRIRHASSGIPTHDLYLDYVVVEHKLGSSGGGGVIEHGSLFGLTDDDHSQYVYLTPGASTRNVVAPTGNYIGVDLKAYHDTSHTQPILRATNLTGTQLYGLYPDTGDVIMGDTTTKQGQLTVQMPLANWEVSIGAEKVTNGTFDVNANWTGMDGVNWVWDGVNFKVTHTAGNVATLSQSISGNGNFLLRFTISDRSGGNIQVQVGSFSIGPAGIGANGAYEYGIYTSSNCNITITPTSDFNGKIDGISLVQVTPVPYPALSIVPPSGKTGTIQISSSGGVDNIFIGGGGKHMISSNITGYGLGDQSTFIGSQAGLRAMQVDSSVYIGYQAGRDITSGYQSIVIGSSAASSAKVLYSCNIIGYNSAPVMQNANGTTVLGTGSLSLLTTAQNCTVVGNGSGTAITDGGSGNGRLVIVGQSSGVLATGGYNHIFGCSTGNKITSGQFNVVIGGYFANGASTGSRNTAIGYYCAENQQAGSDNFFAGGNQTARGNASGWSGSENVVIGGTSMFSVAALVGTGHDRNVAIGSRILTAINNTGGATTTNVMLGSYLAINATYAQYNVVLGTYAASNAGDTSLVNKLIIHSASAATTTPMIYGDFTGATQTLLIHGQSTSTPVLVVKAKAAATADPLQAHDSSGTILAAIDINGSYYLGSSGVDGSWRIAKSTNDLVIERRESGVWVTKDKILAAGRKVQALGTREGAVTATAGTLRIPNHTGRTLTIVGVYLDIGTAPTGAALIVDVHKDGTTIFTTQSNRPQIAAGANAGNSTTIEVASWADGSYLTFDVDQIGSTIAGSDLTVTVVYY